MRRCSARSGFAGSKAMQIAARQPSSAAPKRSAASKCPCSSSCMRALACMGNADISALSILQGIQPPVPAGNPEEFVRSCGRGGQQHRRDGGGACREAGARQEGDGQELLLHQREARRAVDCTIRMHLHESQHAFNFTAYWRLQAGLA